MGCNSSKSKNFQSYALSKKQLNDQINYQQQNNNKINVNKQIESIKKEQQTIKNAFLKTSLKIKNQNMKKNQIDTEGLDIPTDNQLLIQKRNNIITQENDQNKIADIYLQQQQQKINLNRKYVQQNKQKEYNSQSSNKSKKNIMHLKQFQKSFSQSGEKYKKDDYKSEQMKQLNIDDSNNFIRKIDFLKKKTSLPLRQKSKKTSCFTFWNHTNQEIENLPTNQKLQQSKQKIKQQKLKWDQNEKFNNQINDRQLDMYRKLTIGSEYCKCYWYLPYQNQQLVSNYQRCHLHKNSDLFPLHYPVVSNQTGKFMKIQLQNNKIIKKRKKKLSKNFYHLQQQQFFPLRNSLDHNYQDMQIQC
ncbi:hypothetical protein PPERSA_07822 [Pseudocohnilembus persalinus]|uniref:Uncharacterized protein n=1 Tax=Pseudocohnilembus persalinus TaxID=266149 RepID=A0A0V0QC60_PSEPJ|nr:hypothetical protein PPERSA_07822 [Pseudocohnilembus persalinus]|eukprot:KRW99745.1 hypothetical protein PPERSA_07822 [Pseudocohnilembus persalinus]